jgi:predicted dehydrogenase
MGNQRHALDGIRRCREWIDAGAIGPVRTVHLWTDRPIWPQGIDRPTDPVDVPPTLDWDRWLGTAPARPYHPAYAPFRWRGWWDFGCGALGDMGCHIFDAAFWALDLGMPAAVSAETSPVNRETAPAWSIVTYEFPARGDKPPVRLVWYDGGKRPPRPPQLEPDRALPTDVGGQLIVGDAGTILADAYCENPRLIPETKMQAFRPPPPSIPSSPGQHQEWIRACKGGPPPLCNFDYAGPLTEVVLLGNLAIRSGRRIEWDAANMRCPNAPEANEYVQHDYRAF